MNYHGRDKDIQIKVGLMTVMTVIILFFGYSWFRDWFNKGRYTIVQVRFVNAGNIDIGNPVTVFGAKKGRVENITMTETGVILDLLLDLEYPLPIDTKFYISDSNLMGSRQVDVLPGTENQFISDGFVAQGESLSSFSALIPRIDGVISKINDILDSVSGSEDLPEKLLQTVSASHRIIQRIDNLLLTNEQELTDTIENFHHISRQLDEIITTNKDNINESLAGATQSLEKLETALVRLDNILIALEPFIASLSQEESTFHRVFNEEELYEKIIDATTGIDSLLNDIRKNPRRYFKFSIF